MKSVFIGLLCLFSAVVWTQGAVPSVPVYVAGGFSYVDDIYAVSTVAKMNWFQAEAFCAAQGYTLVSIADETVQDTVFTIIQNSGLERVLTEPIWTSGTNLAVSTQWNWFSSGETMSYRNFEKDPTKAYRCLGLDATTGKWGTYNCNDQRYFICQSKCT